MDDRANPSFIPAEALARQARLASILEGMASGAPSLEPAPLQALRRAIADPAADAPAAVASVVAADLAEEALEVLRGARARGLDPARAKAFGAQLDPHAAKALARREAGWQLDARRTRVRLAFAKEGAALDFDDGDLHAILLQAFRLEGLRLALDLGKRPRPMLKIDLPLPAGAGGGEEWVDATFRPAPGDAPDSVLARLNARLPEGLRFHRWEPHPAYASPLADLAESFHWQWACPPSRLGPAQAHARAFLAAPVWIWEKAGRVEGRKQVKPLDLRPLVLDLRWEGSALHSRTRAEATANPLRLHAAILDLEPAELVGLTRLSTTFRTDPRLALAERFEPKLKNIYEDAVLLGGGSNIVLVDEDDDEPLRLG